jgi:predicted KAP-like P-loop ATPase
MNIEDRLDYLNGMLFALDGSWSKIAAEIQGRIDGLTLKLISENDDQVRGAIKALRDLKDLQETLEYERQHIKEALAEQDAAT